MDAVKGKKLIYLYRLYSERTTTTGLTLAFTTENSRSVSKDADSTVTKDGMIRTPNEAEIEITATSILAKGDALIGKLEQAQLNDSLMEIWEANLEEAGATNGTFKGTYYQGYLTSFEKSSPADGQVECSLTFGINGKGATGDVTVSQEQQDIAAYVFADTTQVTGTT